MTFHFRDSAESGLLAVTAPCGYVYRSELRGLDFVTTWSEKSDGPIVDCIECLMHRPKRRKIQQWQGNARRR